MNIPSDVVIAFVFSVAIVLITRPLFKRLETSGVLKGNVSDARADEESEEQ